MKKFFLLSVFIAAAPLNVSAALTHFPVSQPEIEQHVIKNTDIVVVGYSWPGEIMLTSWSFDRYTKDDGTEESIHALALRDPQGFKDLLVRMLHSAVDTIDKSDLSLAGKTLQVAYLLRKDSHLPARFPVFDLFIGNNEVTLESGSDGKIIVPSEAFHVAFSYPQGGRFYIPNILSAEVTAEDGQVYSSNDTNSFHPYVEENRDEFDVSLYPQLQQHGTLHLTFRGGVEQTFNLQTGDLIETILPDLQPTALVHEGGGLYLLVQGPEDGREVVVDTAPDLPAGVFPRWEELPVAELIKDSKTKVSAPGVLAVPIESKRHRGFFQARAVPSSKKVLPPKAR